MNVRRTGLNGFNSLRTRPNTPVNPALLRPKRYCEKCGALLRASNPGPCCAVCDTRRVEIPAWAIALAEIDDSQVSLEAIAGALTGPKHKPGVAERNARIYADWKTGEYRQQDLAAKYQLAANSVSQILQAERKKERAR